MEANFSQIIEAVGEVVAGNDEHFALFEAAVEFSGRNLEAGQPEPEEKRAFAAVEFEVHAVAEGFVSVSPLKVDLTAHAALEKVGTWFDRL